MADAFVAICLAHGVDAIVKWVDDLIFFRFPTSLSPATYAFDSKLIFKIAYRLRLPWNLPKH